MNNQYDLSRVYGFPISNPQMLPGSTIQNTLTDRIPSLSEIADYNMQQQQGYTNTINVPQILNNQSHSNTLGAGNSSTQGVTELRPAPQIPEVLPNTQSNNLLQSFTPAGGMNAEMNDSVQYLNGLIRTQIGRRASIDFLLGTSGTVTKDGYILGVGANYILINELDTNDITACDFYNIKFIRFFY